MQRGVGANTEIVRTPGSVVCAPHAQAAKSVPAEDLARGKAQAKLAALGAYEARATAVDDLARQATGTGKVATLAETLAAIDKVTGDDVVRVRLRGRDRRSACARAKPRGEKLTWPDQPTLRWPRGGAHAHQAAGAALKSKPTAVAYGDVQLVPTVASLGL